MPDQIELNRRVCDTCEHHESLSGKTNKMLGAAIFIWPIVSILVLGFMMVNASGISDCKKTDMEIERKFNDKMETERSKFEQRMDNIDGGIMILQLNMKRLMSTVGLEYISGDAKSVTQNEIR